VPRPPHENDDRAEPDDRDEGERRSEDQALDRQGAMLGAHELREERQEEGDHLGIRQVIDQPLHEISPRASPLPCEFLVKLQDGRSPPGLHREIDEIGDADELQDVESDRKEQDHGRDTDAGEQGVNDIAELGSDKRLQSGRGPGSQRAREDEHGVGAGRKNDHDRRCQEQDIGLGVEHVGAPAMAIDKSL
jgi:hypothetical protein